MEKFLNFLINYDYIKEIEKTPKSIRPLLYYQCYEILEKEKIIVDKLKKK